MSMQTPTFLLFFTINVPIYTYKCSHKLYKVLTYLHLCIIIGSYIELALVMIFQSTNTFRFFSQYITLLLLLLLLLFSETI